MNMNVKTVFLLLTGLLLLGAAAGTAQAQVAWPDPTAWIPYTWRSDPVTDSGSGGCEKKDPSFGNNGANPDAVDFFTGCDFQTDLPLGLPTVYYYFDATNEVIFFRLRQRGKMTKADGSLEQYTWNVLIDTDGDGYKEFFVTLNGNANPDTMEIYYGDNNSQAITIDDCITSSGIQGLISMTTIVMNNPPTVGNVRAIQGTGADPLDDYGWLLDWQVPLTSFVDCSGTQKIYSDTPITFFFTTSTTPSNPTLKDWLFPGEANGDNTGNFPVPTGDPITPGGGISPNPAILETTGVCGTGTTYDITVYLMDALDYDPVNDKVIDTIDNVSFYYRQAGTSTWTLISSVTDPVSGTYNTWTTTWNYSGLPTSPTPWYQIRIVATDSDTPANSTENTSQYVKIDDCTPLLIQLAEFKAMPLADRVVLLWKTDAEIENAGFHLWRTTADGEDYVQLTAQLIPGRGGETWGADYAFSDLDVEPGQTYLYYLEDIDFSGVSTMHGPVEATVLEMPWRMISDAILHIRTP
ncbi:MAG: hypothetical protein JXQ27_10690 [Acidobacteria bacterium]|nr:hypothetical protein [Acidobacteriota bacterium]